MTREEVKAQLAKNPLVWKEEEGRPVYGLHSRVTLIDGEDGDEDAYDALRIDFQIDVDKANSSCSVDVSAHGRWEFGNYDLIRSIGYIIPLEVLKDKAEEKRLSMACRLLGIKD
ncbi:hypothetical protein [uncultured Porphyromonas sp.]|uniref:hypothetical protein n=1 Tax=uncultured Porphyromonas sp. TaxID=159274 RepID=UPI00260DFE0C|nr:hypothetical protein [uncultured Porphyromonas sp.]